MSANIANQKSGEEKSSARAAFKVIVLNGSNKPVPVKHQGHHGNPELTTQAELRQQMEEAHLSLQTFG